MSRAESNVNIPAGWLTKSLGEIATISRGGSPRPIESYITSEKDGLNWLRIGDIKPGAKYIYATEQKIRKEGLSKSTLVEKGDFILSNSMSFGRPYIMQISACIHDGWLALKKIKTDLISKDFLYYLLSSDRIQNRFISISAGSGVQNLKKETVRGVLVMLPLVNEQKRIVKVLETWVKAIELLAKKIELKKQIKKGLMQRLLTGDVRLPGFTDKWRILKLGDFCKIRRGDMITKNTISHGNIPVIAGGRQPAYYHNQSNYDGKTITVSGSGASAGFINYFSSPIFASDCSIIKGIENKADTEFIYYQLLNRQEYIYSLQSGGAQPHIYPKDLASLKIWIPGLNEQTELVNIFSITDKEIELLDHKYSFLEKQRQYLLNNLISGTIRTPESMVI